LAIFYTANCNTSKLKADYTLSKEAVVNRALNALLGRSELLKDYFNIHINEHTQQLEALPYLVERYIPDLDALPLFLVRLTTNVDWTVEEECFDSICRELATFYAGGGMQLETAGSSGNQEGVIPHAATKQSVWDDTTWPFEDGISFECSIRTLASVADLIIVAGFKLTIDPDDATDDDQAIFQFDDGENGDRWWAIESVGGTDTKTDTGHAAVAANTAYKLRITVNTNRYAEFFINDHKVHSGGVQLTSGLTTIKPVLAIETTTGSAKNFVVRWVKCWKNYT